MRMQGISGTALNRVIPIYIAGKTKRRVTPQTLYCTRTMSNSTVNKSDSEWRAVLSPLQVSTHLIPGSQTIP